MLRTRHASPVFALALALVPVGAQAKQEPPVEPVWEWAGFEVMGYRTVTREQVLDGVPIELGQPMDLSKRASWRRWADERKRELGLHAAITTVVRYVGFKGYLVVDVVEVGDEHRLEFRARPDGDVELADEKVRAAYADLERVGGQLFDRGEPPREFADRGYLDYHHDEMHAIVERLRELVPPHRENLLEVIEHSRSDSDRADAARLLNWAGEVADSIERATPFFDDPSPAVRNNLARFSLHYVERLTSAAARERFIAALARTLDGPGHGDRNKALYALMFVARKFPDDRARIEALAGPTVRTIAGRSILSNVRDPARQLAELIDG